MHRAVPPREAPMSWPPSSPQEVPDPADAFSWDPEPSAPRSKPRRQWREKFGDAFRGLKLGIRGHSSFAVHFFFSALVVAAALILGCELMAGCLLLLCIGLVLTVELCNSAVETLFRGLDEATRERAWPCLDIAAGAVLLASITASVVGGLILLYQLVRLL